MNHIRFGNRTSRIEELKAVPHSNALCYKHAQSCNRGRAHMLNANYVIEFTELAKRLNYTETARRLT